MCTLGNVTNVRTNLAKHFAESAGSWICMNGEAEAVPGHNHEGIWWNGIQLHSFLILALE